MSKWCNTCHRNELKDKWNSCSSDCPIFGKDFDDLAEIVIKQKEENEALRFANKQIIKVEKEKRRELWKKAIKEFAEKLREKKDVEFYDDVECGITFQYETVDIDDVNDIEKEMIDHIKE